MLRRHLIALGGITLAGAPVEKLGERLDDLGDPDPAPLPSKLSSLDVVKVRDLTLRLSDAGRAYGANSEVDSAAAAAAARLLTVSGPAPVKRALMAAVAERYLLAGWSALDAGLYRQALHHYARALELAQQAGDAYGQASALHLAGVAAVEHGHPDDGLKLLQCAQVVAGTMPAGHERRARVQACGLMDSATALAALGDPRVADRYVGTARDLWSPTPTDRNGDLDLVPALLEIDRGRLDTAEQFAAASVRFWDGKSQRTRTRSGIVLATVYVKAGEPKGLRLAHNAITDVTKLSSVRVRTQLASLVEALETRSGSDAKELARLARQVAA